MAYWRSETDGVGYSGEYLINHHSNQNLTITRDFLKKSLDNIALMNVLNDSRKIIEIGCGTGQLLHELSLKYPEKEYLGLDIAPKAIDYAHKNFNTNDKLRYKVFDFIKGDAYENGKFDLSICSNCLEHFKDPYAIIDKMFMISKHVLILVPYNQNPMTDGYDEEGGAGHIFKFVENSFERYNTISSFKFFSHGWVCGDNPLQWSILLEKK